MRKLLSSILLLTCAVIAWTQGDSLRLRFSPEGGVHQGPVEVEILAPVKGATIYYTTDGTLPTSGSRRYKGPISVKNPTSIRARYYTDGKGSNVYTASYLNERRYSLPVVSISMDPVHLWDSLQGIHAMGCCADSVMPYQGANFWKGWERRCNVELYEKDGSQGINQECGIRIFGGYSKGLPQKSFALVARSKYGSKRFDYELFPNQNPKIDEYKAIVLRNNGGDFRTAQIRDAFTTQLAKPLGLTIQAYRPAIVYINGKYWGIMSIREKINEHFLEAHFGVDKDSLDLLKHRYDSQHGKSKGYRALLKWMASQDFSVDSSARSLRDKIDLQDFLNYNITETYSDNRDAGGNIRYWKPHAAGSKWRWILFDMDAGMGNSDELAYKKNTVDKFTRKSNEIWPDPAWSTFLIRKVLESDSMRNAYVNTWCDVLSKHFNKERALRLLDSLTNEVAEEMPYHLTRWGGSMKTWNHQLGVVKEFVSNRPEFIYGFLAEKFEMTDPVDVSFAIQGRGEIRVNSLNIRQGYTGKYFKEVPMHVTIEPAYGYHFTGWNVEGYEQGELKLSGPLDLVARFEANDPSATEVVLNEVCFKQPDSVDCDWIELFNPSGKEVSIKGWRIDEYPVEMDSRRVKKDWTIPAGGYIVLAESPKKFFKVFPAADTNAVRKFKIKLSYGDVLMLYDENDMLVDSLYLDKEKIAQNDQEWAMVSRQSPSGDEWIVDELSPLEANPVYVAWLAEQEKKKQEAQASMMYYAIAGGIILTLGAGIYFVKKQRAKKKEVLPTQWSTTVQKEKPKEEELEEN